MRKRVARVNINRMPVKLERIIACVSLMLKIYFTNIFRKDYYKDDDGLSLSKLYNRYNHAFRGSQFVDPQKCF